MNIQVSFQNGEMGAIYVHTAILMLSFDVRE